MKERYLKLKNETGEITIKETLVDGRLNSDGIKYGEHRSIYYETMDVEGKVFKGHIESRAIIDIYHSEASKLVDSNRENHPITLPDYLQKTDVASSIERVFDSRKPDDLMIESLKVIIQEYSHTKRKEAEMVLGIKSPLEQIQENLKK